MAITGMATVRQSITALYEESEKSAGEGLPMLAIIDSAPPAARSQGAADAMRDTLPIAARFDELRRLADLEMPPSHGQQVPPARPDAAPEAGNEAGPATPPAAASEHRRLDPSADDILLPSEPPAPAAGNGTADLEVDDIRRLVREAWEDETAIGPPRTEPPAGTISNRRVDDPDIATAMEDIAAAVGQSGDAATPDQLDALKAEIVAEMRAEIQAIVETDLKAIVKVAVAEALKDMPAAKPATKTATKAKKAATTRAARKKTAPDKP